MTIQEAYTVLGLPESSSQTEIKEKYNELYNDYHIRLTNAPTPNLKKLYQKNIEELNEALNTLNSGSSNTDLPSSGPVFNNLAHTQRPSISQFQQKNQANTNQPVQSKSKEKKNNNPIIIGVSISVICIAIASFFGINSLETNKKLSEYGTLKVQNDSLIKINNTFSNGKCKIKNDSRVPMTIVDLIVTYRNDKGDLEKYPGRFNTDIAPGAIDSFLKVDGNKVIWDGSVISYYCRIQYNGQFQYYSGLWAKDAGKDGILHLDLGN